MVIGVVAHVHGSHIQQAVQKISILVSLGHENDIYSTISPLGMLVSLCSSSSPGLAAAPSRPLAPPSRERGRRDLHTLVQARQLGVDVQGSRCRTLAPVHGAAGLGHAAV